MTELHIDGYTIKLAHRIFIKHDETGHEINIRVHHMACRKNRPPILVETKGEVGKLFFYTTKEVYSFVKRNLKLELPDTVFDDMNAKLLMKTMSRA